MALRSIANATILFGMVRIPVRVHAAIESSEQISFNLLHANCGSRLRQQYVCINENVVVDRDATVKGYEVQKGQYVTLTQEEQKALEDESTATIAIAELTDPFPAITYLDRCYFLGPDKGADRAYKLLVAALSETGCGAIARYSARGKQYLVMLTISRGRLLMLQLHYADEVRSIDDVELGETAEFGAEELRLVKRLARKLRRRGVFDISQYRDEVKERLRAQIQRKIDGQEIIAAPTADAPAPIVDLLEALKQSISTRLAPGPIGSRASAKAAR